MERTYQPIISSDENEDRLLLFTGQAGKSIGPVVPMDITDYYVIETLGDTSYTWHLTT